MSIEHGILSETWKDLISILSLLFMLVISIIGGIISYQYKKHEWSKERYEILKEVVRALTIIKAALIKARSSGELTTENLNKINRYFDEILPDSEKYIGFSFRSKISSVQSKIKTFFMCYLRPDVSEVGPNTAWDDLVKHIEDTKSEAGKIAGLTFSWNEEEVDLRTFSEFWTEMMSRLDRRRNET